MTHGEYVRGQIKSRIQTALSGMAKPPTCLEFELEGFDLELLEPEAASPDDENFIHYWCVFLSGGEFRVHRQIQQDVAPVYTVRGFYSYEPTAANEKEWETALYEVLKKIFAAEFRNGKIKISCNQKDNVDFRCSRVTIKRAIVRRVEFQLTFEAAF